MKMPKMFQGKKSRDHDVGPSSSMDKLSRSSSSSRGSKSFDSADESSGQLPQHAAGSRPLSTSRVSEIEEVDPKPPCAYEFHEKELAEAFKLIDSNGDGKISAAELGVILECLGEKLSERELTLMVAAVDSDGDGEIDMEEFMDLNKRTQRSAESLTEELRAAFHVFDIDKNNQISPEELHQVLQRLGEESLTMEECCRMIRSVDSDGDGFVNFEEFQKMMSTPVY